MTSGWIYNLYGVLKKPLGEPPPSLKRCAGCRVDQLHNHLASCPSLRIYLIHDRVKVTRGKFADRQGFVKDVFIKDAKIYYEVKFIEHGSSFMEAVDLRLVTGLDLILDMV